MIKSDELRGKIFKKYKSLAQCATAAGLSRNVLYNIINNAKIPDSREVSKIGNACELTDAEVREIFLVW